MIETIALAVALPDWLELLNPGLLGRLVLAAVLGGLVGLEREISSKPAGLRTNLLICVGASLLMELSIGVAALANAENVAAGSPFRADPARIAAQIVSGIGFLGAGTIIQARGSVIGLTTAATIWVVAAIGMAVGARAYLVAIGTTVLVVLSLMFLGRLEAALLKPNPRRRYLIVLSAGSPVFDTLEQVFEEAGLRVETEALEKRDGLVHAVCDVSGPVKAHRTALRRLIASDDTLRITREV